MARLTVKCWVQNQRYTYSAEAVGKGVPRHPHILEVLFFQQEFQTKGTYF